MSYRNSLLAGSLILLLAFPTSAQAVPRGTEDTLSPASEQDAMMASLPDARLVTIAGAGHLANVEKPEEVTSALLTHLPI